MQLLEIDVLSKNGIPIRLSEERWPHIIEGHNELEFLRDEVLETIANPSKILSGFNGELLAIREISDSKF